MRVFAEVKELVFSPSHFWKLRNVAVLGRCVCVLSSFFSLIGLVVFVLRFPTYFGVLI